MFKKVLFKNTAFLNNYNTKTFIMMNVFVHELWLNDAFKKSLRDFWIPKPATPPKKPNFFSGKSTKIQNGQWCVTCGTNATKQNKINSLYSLYIICLYENPFKKKESCDLALAFFCEQGNSFMNITVSTTRSLTLFPQKAGFAGFSLKINDMWWRFYPNHWLFRKTAATTR